jgi:hypothetical protein
MIDHRKSDDVGTGRLLFPFPSERTSHVSHQHVPVASTNFFLSYPCHRQLFFYFLPLHQFHLSIVFFDSYPTPSTLQRRQDSLPSSSSPTLLTMGYSAGKPPLLLSQAPTRLLCATCFPLCADCNRLIGIYWSSRVDVHENTGATRLALAIPILEG